MKFISRSLLIGLLSGLYATESLAWCENHGFGGFGLYSHQQQFAYKKQNQSQASTKQIVLKHNRFVSAKLDEQKVINIDYFIPENFRLATLEASSTGDIEFEKKGKIVLEEIKGSYQLAYKAKTSGAHVIELKAEAIREGALYSKSQKIYLTAK